MFKVNIKLQTSTIFVLCVFFLSFVSSRFSPYIVRSDICIFSVDDERMDNERTTDACIYYKFTYEKSAQVT